MDKYRVPPADMRTLHHIQREPIGCAEHEIEGLFTGAVIRTNDCADQDTEWAIRSVLLNGVCILAVEMT